MRVRIAVVAAAACGLFTLSGCQFLEKDEPASNANSAPTPAASAPASGKSTPSGKSTGGAARNGDLPDVCELLTKAEVTTIAGGKQVTQVDEDGAKPGDATRYCQWQLAGGQLAVFLTKTNAADFKTEHGQQQKVTGVGDDARFADGHLYVLHEGIQIDSYARVSGNEGASLQMAKNAALKVIERL
jgi:hypothetical protein